MFVIRTARDAQRLAAAVADNERNRPVAASRSARTPTSASSVWVSPSGTPADGVWDGAFQVWNTDTSAWESTGEACKVLATNGGAIGPGVVYLGRILFTDDDGLPYVSVGGLVDFVLVNPLVRNADGDYQGTVQVFDPATDSWSAGETVWVRDAN